MATILVADDDQLLRAIIRDQLERAGHTVLEAGDGMAALDIAIEERPEVLLLDVMMPLARGLEVVRRVRQQEGWHPAIVMISARTRVTDRLNALEAGADAYVEKPFAPDDLLATISRLLSDPEPARFVDVLGPVWATLALERLLDDAIGRRTHHSGNSAGVTALFTELVAATVGRLPGPDLPTGPAADAMRMLWEDAIRGLLRDSAELIPTTTEVALPDALTAVERAITDETLRRHRARIGNPTPLPDFWGDVLNTALGTPTPPVETSPERRDTTDAWTRRLRTILSSADPDPATTATWSSVLSGVLETRTEVDPVAATTIDPLTTVWLDVAARAPRHAVHR